MLLTRNLLLFQSIDFIEDYKDINYNINEKLIIDKTIDNFNKNIHLIKSEKYKISIEFLMFLLIRSYFHSQKDGKYLEYIIVLCSLINRIDFQSKDIILLNDIEKYYIPIITIDILILEYDYILHKNLHYKDFIEVFNKNYSYIISNYIKHFSEIFSNNINDLMNINNYENILYDHYCKKDYMQFFSLMYIDFFKLDNITNIEIEKNNALIKNNYIYRFLLWKEIFIKQKHKLYYYFNKQLLKKITDERRFVEATLKKFVLILDSKQSNLMFQNLLKLMFKIIKNEFPKDLEKNLNLYKYIDKSIESIGDYQIFFENIEILFNIKSDEDNSSNAYYFYKYKTLLQKIFISNYKETLKNIDKYFFNIFLSFGFLQLMKYYDELLPIIDFHISLPEEKMIYNDVFFKTQDITFFYNDFYKLFNVKNDNNLVSFEIKADIDTELSIEQKLILFKFINIITLIKKIYNENIIELYTKPIHNLMIILIKMNLIIEILDPEYILFNESILTQLSEKRNIINMFFKSMFLYLKK